MKTKILLIFIFLIYAFDISAQTYKFEIISDGEKIGIIEGNIKTNKDITKVNIRAVADVRFIIEEHVDYLLNSVYKDSELYFSSATVFLNNKLHFSSVIRRDGPYYTITKDDHKTMFTNLIAYSGSLLYFMEPKEKQKIFSEIDNIEKDISKEAKSVYKIVNPQNGNASYFTYENGILKSAKIHHTHIDIEVYRL